MILGENYLDQINRIIAVLGSPSSEDLSYIQNKGAREFVMKFPKKNKVCFSKLFPKANPSALDLLDKILVFNQNKRITVEECLAHPYFSDLNNDDEAPICEKTFDWSFDDIQLNKEKLQNDIYEEALLFNPKK